MANLSKILMKLPTAEVRRYPLEELLAYVRRPTQTPKRIKKQQKADIPRRIYRRLTHKQRLSIVQLNKQWNLPGKTISQLTGVPRTTIDEVLIAYQRNGTHESQQGKKQRGPWPIPEEVSEFLLNNLYEHRFLTIQHRCNLVK